MIPTKSVVSSMLFVCLFVFTNVANVFLLVLFPEELVFSGSIFKNVFDLTLCSGDLRNQQLGVQYGL